uniref:Ribosomal protein S7 n=1 Tax=Lobosphaera incisa TaxID=312850 RepID=A0A0F7DXE4_9CHLO|nr:ribosomal protein S7 [Lobosphaera incisa]AKF78660.1 ribosomal protein S7 [Lobosphaera incisa]
MNAFKEFTNNLQGTKNPALYKKLIDSNYSRFIKWEKQNEYPFLYSRSPLFSVFFDQAFQFYKKRPQQFPVFINTNKNKTRLKTSVKGEPYITNQIGSGANKQNGNTFSHYYKAKDMEQRFINLLMVSGKKKKANQIFVTAENKFTLILEKVMESEKSLSITPKAQSLQKKQSNEKISTLVLSQIKLKTELLVSTKQKQIEKGYLFPQSVGYPISGKNVQEKGEKDGSRKKNGATQDPISSHCLSLQNSVGLLDTNRKGCGIENNLQQTSPCNLLDTPPNSGFNSTDFQCSIPHTEQNTDFKGAVGYTESVPEIITTKTEKLSLLSLNLQDKLFGYQPHFSSSYFTFPDTTGLPPQTFTQKNSPMQVTPYDYSILQKKYKKGSFKIEQGQSNHVEGEVSTLLGTKSILCSPPLQREQTGTGSGAEKNGKKAKSSLSAYLQKAVENVTPNLEIRKVRIGRKTYQVPALISQKKGEGLAIRWIIDAATQSNKKSKRDFSDSLAQELLLAYNKKGQARQKRDELHKIAQANRAYIRYRWW